MKTTTKHILAISTGIILIGSLSACGHHGFHGSPEKRAEHMVEHISDDLELNEAQTANLNTLKTELLDLRKQMKQDRESRRNTLLEIVSQPTLDRERAENLIQQRLQTLQSQTPDIIAAAGNFYDSLNEEQQKTLRDEIEKFTEKSHRFGFGH